MENLITDAVTAENAGVPLPATHENGTENALSVPPAEETHENPPFVPDITPDVPGDGRPALTPPEMIYGAWLAEGEELKAEYPSFELEREFRDPEFLSLLRSGLGVRRAFYALRHDALVKEAETRAAENTVREIRSQGLRPGENAASPRSSGGIRRDVRSMTHAEILDLIEKVQSGAKVSF